jgi:nucleoside-diphosphate-sugar epimerase
VFSSVAASANAFVVADATRLKQLGWRQQFSLEQGLDNLHRSL